MTKPANFPERKRQRQIKALERLERTKSPVRRDGETDQQYAARRPAWEKRRDLEIQALTERTASAGSQRDKRTKKYRGSGREFERNVG